MSSISNKVFVTAIDDGTTLHGSLQCATSLTQSWNGSACVPNWDVEGNQPIIYLSLTSGNQRVNAVSGDNNHPLVWYYNEEPITFNDQDVSTSPEACAGKLKKTTVTIGEDTEVTYPALRIVGNLASDDNVDFDTIGLSGFYHAGGTSYVDFNVSTMIRISKVGANSYTGIVAFVGDVDFNIDGQDVRVFATLYGGSSGSIVAKTNYIVEWYINGTLYSAGAFPNSATYTYTDTDGDHYALRLNEADVTDNAIVECKFYDNSSPRQNIYTEFVNINDLTDPELMYIQYNYATGLSATLRSGETTQFVIWVGESGDPTPKSEYSVYKAKFVDASGAVIQDTTQGTSIFDSSLNIGAADTNGWRTIGYGSVTGYTGNRGYFSLNYSTVTTFGKSISCYILAQTGA